jgi:hypothetical protein
MPLFATQVCSLHQEQEFVAGVSGRMIMKPHFARLLANILFADSESDAPKSELAESVTEMTARQRCDKLDKWLAAAIVELSDEKRAAS